MWRLYHGFLGQSLFFSPVTPAWLPATIRNCVRSMVLWKALLAIVVHTFGAIHALYARSVTSVAFLWILEFDCISLHTKSTDFNLPGAQQLCIYYLIFLRCTFTHVHRLCVPCCSWFRSCSCLISLNKNIYFWEDKSLVKINNCYLMTLESSKVVIYSCVWLILKKLVRSRLDPLSIRVYTWLNSPATLDLWMILTRGSMSRE